MESFVTAEEPKIYVNGFKQECKLNGGSSTAIAEASRKPTLVKIHEFGTAKNLKGTKSWFIC